MLHSHPFEAYLSAMFRCFLFIVGVLHAWTGFSQTDTFTVMHYNILRFPEANALKAPLLRPIINYVQPDVITMNEITAIQALDSLDAYAFDTSKYAHAPWITDNELVSIVYYRKDKLAIKNQGFLYTSPRRTNYYRFYSRLQDFSAIPDTLFFTVFVTHMKSSQGEENEYSRAQQAATVRAFMDALPPGSNILFNGDFNLYTAAEPAWINLTASGNHQLHDPIYREGNWNNNASFSDIHTQSPRTTSFDMGVTGGLDDRFDFILASTEVMDGRYGFKALPSTYKAIGNDGQHFNKSILATPTNTSVPDSVLQALHNFSDHLPVQCRFEFKPAPSYLGFLPAAPSAACELEFLGMNATWDVYTLQGRKVQAVCTTEDWKRLPSGLYGILKTTSQGQQCFFRILKTE